MSPAVAAAQSDRLRCPYCGLRRSRTAKSKRMISLPEIRRRKECFGCHRRYTTIEVVGERDTLAAIPVDDPQGVPCVGCEALQAQLNAIGRALRGEETL